MKVAALIVTYNRSAMLKYTLSQTLQMSFERVVVVNNGSTDETASWLNGLDDPRMVVLHQSRNTGGAGGFAAGLTALSTLSGWTHVCLYDDDAQPAKNWLAELSQQPAADIWLSDVRNALNQPCKMNLPYVRIPRTLLQTLCYVISPDRWLPGGQRSTTVESLTFVGCCLTREFLPQLMAVLDTRLFLYFDDLTAGSALARQGARILWCPALRFRHDVSVRASMSPERRRLLTRNLLWLSRCDAGAPWGACVTCLRVMGQLFAVLKGTNKCSGIVSWVRGICDGVVGPGRRSDG